VGDGGTTLRVATLARTGGVEVVLRSSESGFAVDHFRAVCRPVAVAPPPRLSVPDEQVALDVDQLYGTLLFQRPPFQRVRRYLRLSSTECVAEVAIERHVWFGRYLPASLAGGDAGARDAAIHAIQACIPQATVLPFAIERIERWLPLPERGSVIVFARERACQRDEFIYDVDLVSGDGTPLERWSGLALRAVERRSVAALPPALWGPFLERELPLLLGDDIHIAATPDRVASTASETRRLAGARAFRRGDGKPLAEELQISASRARDVRLTATSIHPVAVDVQDISPQPWDQILDPSHIAVAQTIASERSEPFSVAATRVWGAMECIKKLGGRAGAPLSVRGAHDSFVRFSSGRRDLASTILETPERMRVVVTVANAS
jgi:enediyne polyketide synthase